MSDPSRPTVSDSLSMRLATSLDQEVLRLVPISGGDTAAAFRVDLVGGDVVFAKTHRGGGTGRPSFATEAAGLAWLAEPGALRVPSVLALSDGDGDDGSGDIAFLALEWVAEGASSAETETRFGSLLARTHDSGAPAFGRADRARTGSLGLPNDPCETWSEFYASCRLLPLAAIAADRRSLPDAAIADLEGLAARLDQLGGPVERASRLHGDLWAGNRMVGTGGVNWLIDPAAHGGHREFDLAMMRLFGGFGADCFEAYEAHSPLADGWKERVALHQVAPLMVHAIKFGGSYVGAAVDAINRYR